MAVVVQLRAGRSPALCSHKALPDHCASCVVERYRTALLIASTGSCLTKWLASGLKGSTALHKQVSAALTELNSCLQDYASKT